MARRRTARRRRRAVGRALQSHSMPLIILGGSQGHAAAQEGRRLDKLSPQPKPVMPGNCNGHWSNEAAFAAMTTSGEIRVWGNSAQGGADWQIPEAARFKKVVPSSKAFAALSSTGVISAWGSVNHGASGAPTGDGFVDIASIRFHRRVLDVIVRRTRQVIELLRCGVEVLEAVVEFTRRSEW